MIKLYCDCTLNVFDSPAGVLLISLVKVTLAEVTVQMEKEV